MLNLRTGRETGEYLLRRHETIEKFLEIIGVTQNLLKDTEQIEHNISDETYQKLILLLQFLEQNGRLKEFQLFSARQET